MMIKIIKRLFGKKPAKKAVLEKVAITKPFKKKNARKGRK